MKKTDAEYITQYPDTLPLRKWRASIIGQLLLKDLVKEETDAV